MKYKNLIFYLFVLTLLSLNRHTKVDAKDTIPGNLETIKNAVVDQITTDTPTTTKTITKVTSYFQSKIIMALKIEYSDGSTKNIGGIAVISSQETYDLRQVPIVSVSVSTTSIPDFGVFPIGISFKYVDSTIQTLFGTINSNAITYQSSNPGQCLIDIDGALYNNGLVFSYDDVDVRYPVQSSLSSVSQYYYQELNGESRYLYDFPSAPITDLAANIGPTSQINIPNKSVYDFKHLEFSATSLVRTTVPGTIMSKKPEAGGGGWRIVINTKGVIIFTIEDGSSSSRATTQPTQILDGNWHHVAVVRRLSQTSNEIEVWLDAVKLVSFQIQNYFMSATSNNPLLIGANYNITEPHFDGSIDDVTLWNVSLSQIQIIYSMKKMIGGNEFGLIGYWPFDNNFIDKSSTSNNGASSGVIDFTQSITSSSNIGWSFGGYSFKAFQVPWSLFINPTTATDPQKTLVYRFKFTQSNGDRFYYTTDSSFTSSGWVYDSVAFQIYGSNIDIPSPSVKPVYRYSRTQIPSLGSGLVYGYSIIPNLPGWINEGIDWYTSSDSTPSFLSYPDLEYKMIQNVGSQKCLTAPTTSGSSVTLSTCDQSNLQQFWYLKYDSFGPHLYNPQTMMYLNSQTTTLIGTTSIPQNNFNIFINQMTNGRYTIQEYISSLCLQLNTVSNIVEFKTCNPLNQNQIWKYPSSVLVESSKSIPLFPGACLDSLGLKCPTTLPEVHHSQSTLKEMDIYHLNPGGSEVYSLGVTSSTGPYSITIQSDGNVVLKGNTGTYAAIGCWNLGGQYLNLLDNNLYGLQYGMIVQNNQNKMIWSKLGYSTSFRIALIPGSFIDDIDTTNNYVGVNQFITNGREYLTVRKTASGDSFGAYLYPQNPNYLGQTALWKYEYPEVFKEDLRIYVHYMGDKTTSLCLVNTFQKSMICGTFFTKNTPSFESSRYLQLPAPGSDKSTDWAIVLRSATGSLTFGYFGNSKTPGNYALQPDVYDLYQSRFLSLQISQYKYSLKNVFSNQIIQESPANLQLCKNFWTTSTYSIYQVYYDSTMYCSNNAKIMIETYSIQTNPAFPNGKTFLLLTSMPEMVVYDQFGVFIWSQGYSTL
ncbi:hypothetical protein PPL_08488 [Heterostelium album PN500]|uniref:Laminin G domain-containing protein n=1 Tax=Heterostelium pallidum (strain ATCC 26659 / Pp 5 / PN500) TaxID=670386 RepID=D3BIC0_HETP5|nr:hypothetical protein PPL_08488 [Heterostelium album PN500]EFA79020.1 hypothetical protein PPL_08488 [Heterostelium album PN500]|eukprot:XP_020431143.1 hypothetical protein PPL_08488 [Heterostelium album PN500]